MEEFYGRRPDDDGADDKEAQEMEPIDQGIAQMLHPTVALGVRGRGFGLGITDIEFAHAWVLLARLVARWLEGSMVGYPWSGGCGHR
jgi:hypothetical protein